MSHARGRVEEGKRASTSSFPQPIRPPPYFSKQTIRSLSQVLARHLLELPLDLLEHVARLVLDEVGRDGGVVLEVLAAAGVGREALQGPLADAEVHVHGLRAEGVADELLRLQRLARRAPHARQHRRRQDGEQGQVREEAEHLEGCDVMG
ncbi:hypothetical protein PG989_015050 [Apiospora arundinis]